MNPLELGMQIVLMWEEQRNWSQKNVGLDSERGPIGPLKHLEKEAKEAYENPDDISEYADCLILILDAARRRGLTLEDLVYAARNKIRKNWQREWPKGGDPNEPIEHKREEL